MDKIGGKYEIIRQLGSGSTSTVYLCHDPFAARNVAVKRMHLAALQDPQHGRQFHHFLMNEASLVGKLQHPHIVQLYDAVIEEHESYIVMEYVPGGSLERYCSPDTLLPIKHVVEIIFKCIQALAYANRLGIIHRDIKPANILLNSPCDASGPLACDIKISDFGACLLSHGEPTHTQVLGVGSPAYMSPQQLREETLNHQTDIYSLGVVMFQLLTGRLPFQANSKYGLIYQICNLEAPPPSSFRSEIPPLLDSIVQRALQRELADRYASWQAFARDLVQLFHQQQISPSRKTPAESEKFSILRNMRFFDDFSDVEIWEIVHFGSWQTAKSGEYLLRDGEIADHLLILSAGSVEVRKAGRPLARLGAGEVLGEIAVVDRRHSKRIADVVTLSDVRFIKIAGASLRQASDSCRMHFYEGFLRVMAERLAHDNQLLAHV